jgi:hypothetical protein
VSGVAVQAPTAPPAPATDNPRSSFDAPRGPMASIRRWLTRPLVACLALLAVYATITLAFNDPRGTLGTDTGGKLATLHVMGRDASLVPEIGYWASAEDPKGDVHPIFYTFKVDGKWVNVTTLPMIYAAYPLFELGGDRAVLLIPMLGSLLCALAARALARRLRRGSGWSAFWVIGLLSPVAIYALDFWEHSLGLALMLWGVVWALRSLESRAPLRDAAIAGLLFGGAATMRTEAIVYLVMTGGVVCLVRLWRSRSLTDVLARGVALVVGAVFALAANDVFERVVLGGTIRAGRAAGTAANAGVSATTRVEEAFTTLVGMNRFTHTADYIWGALIVLCVALAIRSLLRAGDRIPVSASAALAGAFFLYLIGFSAGLGFVPGMLTASPFAAVGIAFGWRHDVRIITSIAVVALPVVWFFQYSGGAGPQWGGRYTLLSGALLLIAATVVLEGHRSALAAVCVVAVLVTGFGLTWLSVRSHWAAHGIEQLVDRHDQAVISGEAHILREGGAFYDRSRHWLTATDAPELRRAVSIIRGVGDTEFAYVVSDGVEIPRTLGAFRRTSVQRVAFLRPDIYLKVATFRTP